MGRPKKELAGDDQMDLFAGTVKSEVDKETFFTCPRCGKYRVMKTADLCWPCQAKSRGECPACGAPSHTGAGQGRFPACDSWFSDGY